MTDKQKLSTFVRNVFIVAGQLGELRLTEPEAIEAHRLITEKFKAFDKWAKEQVENIQNKET